MNQEIKAYLYVFCTNHPETWSEYLLDIEFMHNQRIAQNCNISPFYLMMGYNPWAILAVTTKTKIPIVKKCLDNL